MKILSYLPRITLAALFAAGSSTAVLATVATHAGAPASGLLAAAPVAALADPDDRRRHRDSDDRRGWDRNRGNGNRYAGDDRDRNQAWNDRNGRNGNGWNGDNGRANRDSNRPDNDDHRNRNRNRDHDRR